MGYTTKISDSELERGDPPQKASDFDDEKTVTKAKVVTAKEKKPPVSTTAVVKGK